MGNFIEESLRGANIAIDIALSGALWYFGCTSTFSKDDFGQFIQNQSNGELHKICLISYTRNVRAFIFVANDRYKVVLIIQISLNMCPD